MAADITIKDLAPFVAPVLLRAPAGDDGLIGPALLDSFMTVVEEEAQRSTDRAARAFVQSTPVEEDGDLVSQALVYSETATPTWLRRTAGLVDHDDLKERRYELITVSVRGNLVAFCASDATMRERIINRQAVARRVPRSAIQGFIGGDAKALWLNGAHTPTSSKADTKALTGAALEDALDPIGDQTYFLSAARTVPMIDGLKKSADARAPSVGATPAGGRVWIRRADDWENYKRLITVILDVVANPPATDDLFKLLSQPIDSLDDVKLAYGVAVVPPALLSEDDTDTAEREEALRWAYDARYDVTALSDASLSVKVELDGQTLGELELKVSVDDGAAAIQHQWTTGPTDPVLGAQCEAFVADPDRVKIFYDSGHCLAQGRLYEGGYTDQEFGWSFMDFTGYEVGDEKPHVHQGDKLADKIAVDGDTSLFAFVVEKLFLDAKGNRTGWLACDDGSMEAADFVHISEDLSTLSLVHVKAASNKKANRQASPSDYEVVVGQAVKNLRHLERAKLLDELKKGRFKQIGAAVWHNGQKKPNREGFLKAAGKLKARTKKQLIVLQPRIREAERDYCWGPTAPPSRAKRIKQTDTLMLAAQMSAQACGATFVGIAAA